MARALHSKDFMNDTNLNSFSRKMILNRAFNHTAVSTVRVYGVGDQADTIKGEFHGKIWSSVQCPVADMVVVRTHGGMVHVFKEAEAFLISQ